MYVVCAAGCNTLRLISTKPLAVSITFARTYKWQTEDERDQANFVVSLIRLHRSITNGAPLKVVGIRDTVSQSCRCCYYDAASSLLS
jgi:hypothetical protein